MSEYSDWCAVHKVTHGHCPRECSHPQPADYADIGILICGVCYFHDGTVSEIVPCDCPDTLEWRV